jgi:hypothetical protein
MIHHSISHSAVSVLSVLSALCTGWLLAFLPAAALGEETMHIPGQVHELMALQEPFAHRQHFPVPRTPQASLALLDDIDAQIEQLELATQRFAATRKSLRHSIDRLAGQEQRNRLRITGWLPVLEGNLRLLRSRYTSREQDLRLTVALLVLESRIERMDLRVRHARSQQMLSNHLQLQQDQLNQRRTELLAALDETRIWTKEIRRNAQSRRRG